MQTVQRHLHVVHVVSHLDEGGLERVVRDIVCKSDPEALSFAVICLSRTGMLTEEVSRTASVMHLQGQSAFSLLHPKKLIGVLRQAAPDVVHCHTGVWLKAAVAAKRARVPLVVYTEHGRRSPDPLGVRLLDHVASRFTDVVVAVSETVSVDLRGGVVAEDVPVLTIPNGIDVDAFAPSPTARNAIRSSCGIPENAYVIGTLGRLVPIKAYHDLIRSFAIFRNILPAVPAYLLIAGAGPELWHLKELSQRLQVAEYVRFLGWVSHTRDFLSALDIFSLSSISEGTSIGLLEALSAGVCPVVTAVGGNPSVVGPELAECLVPPGQPRAMAEKWAGMQRDQKRRSALAATGQQHVKAHFSLDAMLESYKRLYASQQSPRGRTR